MSANTSLFLGIPCILRIIKIEVTFLNYSERIWNLIMPIMYDIMCRSECLVWLYWIKSMWHQSALEHLFGNYTISRNKWLFPYNITDIVCKEMLDLCWNRNYKLFLINTLINHEYFLNYFFPIKRVIFFFNYLFIYVIF